MRLQLAREDAQDEIAVLMEMNYILHRRRT